MFSKKRKDISLEEMHEVYMVLKDSLPEKEEKLLIDQIDYMLGKISQTNFRKALRLMNISLEDKSDLRIGVEFIRWLRENNFFEYAKFVKVFEKHRGSDAARK